MAEPISENSIHVGKGLSMGDDVQKLESQLDSFDANQRRAALETLVEMAAEGQISFEKPRAFVNLHGHTFFSFNAYGYSPSKFAWLSKKRGLAAAGIVDFDVLDGLDEFLESCRLLDLRGGVGVETRVFVPEFADKEINSPGEPGIAYYTGVGFTDSKLEGMAGEFLSSMKQTAQRRNRELMQRVNAYLKPVELDYEKDAMPLTPAGNPTERHLCLAYARKAQQVFEDEQSLGQYWQEKLGVAAEKLELPEGRALQDTIRAKTMKRGGVGYVQPDAGSFPTMQQMSEFALAAGAIPVHAWLNGLSDGEREIERLLDTAMATGCEGLAIIPDRNFTPGVQDEKLANLQAVITLAQERDLPIFVGTEMNSPGQKFVDDFESDELKPYIDIFMAGAQIAYAHTALQKHAQMGYCSEWAKQRFADRKTKNEFYQQVGEMLSPSREKCLEQVDSTMSPQKMINHIQSTI